MTNETGCSKLLPGHTCQPYVQFGAFPDLFGVGQQFTYFGPEFSCSKLFQYSYEFFCSIFILKCDPELEQIIPPCKEMCDGYLDACHSELPNSRYIDCNYLPSVKEDFPCLYKPIVCRERPHTVTNAKIISDFTIVGNYFFPGIVEYSCKKGFKMEGNKTISCTYDGRWSTPPHVHLKITIFQHLTNLLQKTDLCQ